jgi:hypothetical protein
MLSECPCHRRICRQGSSVSGGQRACASEFDEGEVVGAVFFEAGGDGAEMLEVAEEALDEVAVTIGKALKAGRRLRPGMGLMLAQQGGPRMGSSSNSPRSLVPAG